jgi:hypothetical protein
MAGPSMVTPGTTRSHFGAGQPGCRDDRRVIARALGRPWAPEGAEAQGWLVS